LTKITPVLERFEKFYVPEPNSGCWLWTGGISGRYGSFYDPSYLSMSRAHIVAYKLFRGPVGDLCVLHNCDNTYCVNPDHLRLGTQQDNMDDRESRGRRISPAGERNRHAKLTKEIVLAIRADVRWPRFIAQDYGIPVSTVKKIQYRATWKHV
jgi:hypothetical protein